MLPISDKLLKFAAEPPNRCNFPEAFSAFFLKTGHVKFEY